MGSTAFNSCNSCAIPEEASKRYASTANNSCTAVQSPRRLSSATAGLAGQLQTTAVTSAVQTPRRLSSFGSTYWTEPCTAPPHLVVGPQHGVGDVEGNGLGVLHLDGVHHPRQVGGTTLRLKANFEFRFSLHSRRKG